MKSRKKPSVEYREGHPFRKTNDQFYLQGGIKPNMVCEVEEPAALSSLVLAGLGVAFVPMSAKDNPPFHVLRMDGPVCERVFMVSFPEKRYLSLTARRFRDFLVEYFA